MQWLLLALGILTFVFWGIAFTIFIFALKTFDLSFAYAVWVGSGIVIVSIIGILYFKEPANALKIGSIVLIAIGVTGLGLSDMIR